MPLVVYLARRFSGRNEPMNDLVQVGAIGLIKAIDRFDPERGLEFSTYATPTILGEIKRHFRDTGWLIHVPRRAQELQTTLNAARADLSQELGRAPTVRRARRAHRRRPRTTCIEALDAARAYSGVPLDVLGRRPARRCPSTRCSASIDEGFEQVEQRALLRDVHRQAARGRARDPAAALRRQQDPDRDRRRIVGVSQMQVSRLRRPRPQALRELRSSPASRQPSSDRRSSADGARGRARPRAGGVNSRYSTASAATRIGAAVADRPAWKARL